jgi:hypothetical protein
LIIINFIIQFLKNFSIFAVKTGSISTSKIMLFNSLDIVLLMVEDAVACVHLGKAKLGLMGLNLPNEALHTIFQLRIYVLCVRVRF